MSEEVSIRVNFARPIALFPLDGVVLLPQQVMPLHIFEPRYRQMVSGALDSVGQIAMAVIEKGDLLSYHGSPKLRDAVCVGQIVQHEALADGRYNLLLQGVCRARIVAEEPPDGERLYRMAYLEPVGTDGAGDAVEDELDGLRAWIGEQLETGPLHRLAIAEQVRAYVENEEVPTPALLELVSFAVPGDAEARYRLLAEGDVRVRAGMLRADLEALGLLIDRAMRQRPEEWPRGCSWN